MVTVQRTLIYRGERATLNFTMTAGSVTGRTIAFTVAAQKNAATKLITKAGTVTAAAAFNVALTATDTNLTPGNYYWDAWTTDSGQEELIAEGSFLLTANPRHPV